MPADIDDITTATHDDGQPAKRKRLRIPKSCLPCLKGKRACDRGRPACGRCARSGQANDCSYDPRLPHQPASGSSRQSGVLDDSDDEDDKSFQDSRRLSALQSELEEARNETRRLQQLLRAQQPASSSSPHHQKPAYNRPSSSSTTWPHATANGHYSYSSSNDMHAARGLQMLAEIAGPQHQDADSNAFKSRILHWSGPASHTSSSSSQSQASPNDKTASSSNESSRLGDDNAASSSSSPVDRLANATSSSVIYKDRFQRRTSNLNGNDLDSPKNINGTPMYYGDTSSGDKVLRKVAATTAGSSRATTDNPSSNMQETLARRDMQSAFNSVLDPSRDTFPFATIWSSGTAFIDEVLPFFPKPDEFDSICASFVRHFSAMCPALTIPTAIDHAKAFSRMSRKQQSQVSLPWFAVFLMICALGKNCDLESTTVSVDRKVRMLDAFLTGEASQQPSRNVSRASSPAAVLHQEAASSQPSSADLQSSSTVNARSPAMVSDLFLSAAYQSLRLCSFLSAPTLQTIHSQLLIGAYLLNTERAASFWPLLGSVARQAQSIGLHVDPYKMKPDWDPVEADTRRRLWWAVVHQDVILSSIFGRPLGITRFSCRFPGTRDVGDTSGAITYAVLQCEFSQLARTCLDENQDRSWSQTRIIEFTEQVLQWYMHIPDRYRPDLGRIDLLGSATDEEAIHNYHAAGVDIKTKGLMEVHQSGNLAVEVFYMILSLHRANLFPNADADADASSKSTGGNTSDHLAKSGAGELNQVSLHICAQALRRITRAQTTMIDLLGRARATMFWKIAYYTYQAAIAGAYIVFVNPQSKHAESALEDLAILTDFFDRMPEKWTGLKMAKPGLRVLRKLAVAARETPEAASMAVRSSVQQQQQQQGAAGGMDPVSSPITNGFGYGGGQQQDGAGASLEGHAAVSSGLAGELHATATPSSHLPLTPGGGGGSDTSQMAFNSQSAFLPPIFGSSFLSPTAGAHSVMTASPFGGSSSNNTFGGAVSEPTSLFAGALAASSGSPLTRSLASVPLVTLFNNTYDQQENTSGGAPKQSFCYDPFIPDPTTTFGNTAASSGNEKSSASPSDRQGSSLSSPATALSANSGVQNGAVGMGEEGKGRAVEGSGETQQQDVAAMNQKDLANYWSEYFSLQLDWDRLTGLA
ncbi:C6 transcription factor [Pseudozyma hubeiensis]|nr:C6 transcription factor [Pseudozyma hubeiensis]